jgi:hypothetical protein
MPAAGAAVIPPAGFGAIGLVVARSHADPPVAGSFASVGAAGSASGCAHGAGGAAGSINAVGAGAVGVGPAAADSTGGCELMLRGSGAPHAEQNAPGMGSSTPQVSQMATNDQSASGGAV